MIFGLLVLREKAKISSLSRNQNMNERWLVWKSSGSNEKTIMSWNEKIRMNNVTSKLQVSKRIGKPKKYDDMQFSLLDL